MARYRNSVLVQQIRDGQGSDFAYTVRPGHENDRHGIFRCEACGHEIAQPLTSCATTKHPSTSTQYR